MKRTITCAAALASVALTATLSANAAAAPGENLVDNSQFTKPAVSQWDLLEVGPNALNFGEWSVQKNTVHIYGKSVGKTTRGQSMDLNGGAPATVEQPINTIPGKWYTLTWKHTKNTHAVCANQVDQNYLAGISDLETGELESYEPRSESWKQVKEVTFQASEHQHTIQFSSSVTGGCGAMVTDVIAYQNQ